MKISTILASYCANIINAKLTLNLSCCALLMLANGVPSASGAEAYDDKEELTKLPLERLLDVSVISASRKTQNLGDVTSAVFVINQEDIRHSGATTIPDLLRMVPGVQVASIDGNSWAISIRGFNGTFANKLLVMIDGRSVYTPLYGGVFWDVQDTLLDDVERIEVIRGSGSTMWGANAVNGVINIITKSAQDTKGKLLNGLTGNREHGTIGARYGGEIDDNTSYRLYVKHVERGDTVATTGSADDSLRVTRGGFRIDNTTDNHLNLTIQGEMYGGTVGNSATIPTFSPPFSETIAKSTDLIGGHLLSRIDWLQSASSLSSLQLYYDRTGRKRAYINEDRDTIDIDLQHNHSFANSHELTLGIGYRFLHDQTTSYKFAFNLTPASRSDNLVNLFFQDEITLLPETLHFTIGSKFEHNDYTGWELQPSARLSWVPHAGYSVWAAVTRSIRTPSRSEEDARIYTTVIPAIPPATLPSVIILQGNHELKSETLLAYELGARADLSENVSLDISSYYNIYQEIISPKPGTPFVEGGTQLTIPSYFTNANDYDSCGVEIALQWQPNDWWKLRGGYSYIRFFGDGVEDSLVVKATPEHQATLRSQLAIGRDIDLDLWGRYVGANSYPSFMKSVHIPAYTTLDIRLAWRPLAGVELSLVGQNLLERRHIETVSDLSDVRHEVERTVYGKVAWAF